MAKRQRELRRGDGYVSVRRNKDGTVTAQARWQEGMASRAKSFRVAPGGDSEDALKTAEGEASQKAEDHLRSNGRARRSGRYVPESRMTVNEILDTYLARGKSRKKWSTNTYSTYSSVIRHHIAPYIGAIRLVDLTPERVQQWVDGLTSKISVSMIENARVVLNGACKNSVRLSVIPANPVTGVELPTRERYPYVVWTIGHVQAVMAACVNDVRMRTYYSIALTTGMRPGEIRALKWSDMNLDKGRATVTRTITRDERGRQIIGTTTKTKQSRSVALPANTVKALRSWKVSQAERRLASDRWRDLDLVFDRGDGNLLPQNTLARAHRRIAIEADVPVIRLHDIRHTAASLLVDAGTHIKVVADLLGHSSVAITMDTYSHPGESIQREATDMLGSILDRHA